MRYYFNVKDGKTMLDEEGVELDDIEAVKNEAVQSNADMLKGLQGQHFWSGDPWTLWVTDQPQGRRQYASHTDLQFATFVKAEPLRYVRCGADA